MRSFDMTVRASAQDAAAHVIEVLGLENAASVLCVADARTVARWADGSRVIRGARAEQRLRMVFQAIVELEAAVEPERIWTWFTTVNEDFAYRSAVQLIAEESPSDAGREVVRAAAEYAIASRVSDAEPSSAATA